MSSYGVWFAAAPYAPSGEICISAGASSAEVAGALAADFGVSVEGCNSADADCKSSGATSEKAACSCEGGFSCPGDSTLPGLVRVLSSTVRTPSDQYQTPEWHSPNLSHSGMRRAPSVPVLVQAQPRYADVPRSAEDRFLLPCEHSAATKRPKVLNCQR